MPSPSPYSDVLTVHFRTPAAPQPDGPQEDNDP